jgi:hypothetical protein
MSFDTGQLQTLSFWQARGSIANNVVRIASISAIQKYEHGRNRSLFEICEALDVSLASMFERNLK